MNPTELKNLVEAALLVVAEPLDVNALLGMFEGEPEPPERSAVMQALDELRADYAARGVELKQVAGGYRVQARAGLAARLNRLFAEKPQRYSQALLETLAIIAYRQPVTRAEIEAARGVSLNTGIIRSLHEREWIKVAGHRDAPGRPELLATTRQFLDYFNLKELSALPPLAEVKDMERLEPDLFDEPASESRSSGGNGAQPHETGGAVPAEADNAPPPAPDHKQ